MCRWKNFLTSLVVIFGGAAAALGKDLTVDELRQIQAKMKSFDSLQVDFVQTRFAQLRHNSSTRNGKAVFVKPNAFKWMLETPKKDYSIYDGKSFVKFDPESNTATRFSPNGTQSYELKQLIDLVLNFDTLLRRYDLVKAAEDAGVVEVQLKPKTEAAGGDLTGVNLRFAPKDGFISYLKMEFRSKDTLTHEFKNPSHKAVPADAFQLPKGVKETSSN